MTVRELINKLLDMPMNSNILVGTTINCCHVTPLTDRPEDVILVDLSCYDIVYVTVKLEAK